MWRAAAVLLLAVLSVGCGSPPPAALVHDAAVDYHVGAGVDAPLLVEPAAGVRPLTTALNHAQSSIFVETYILSDSRLIRALERAAAQGVAVYVLLERHPYGLADQPVRVALELEAAGVYVRWSRPDVALTHAKFLVLDDRTAIIGTANLSRAAFSHNREFLVVTQSVPEVHAASNLFRADWNRIPARLGDADLAVSPSNARHKLALLIASARRSILVYGEEIADPGIEHLLSAAARRGMRVRVLLPPYIDPADVRRLRASGVQVRGLNTPYIHAKMVLVDGRKALVGSLNLSTPSLDRNRELSVLLRGDDVRLLAAVFQRDWRGAHP